MKHPIQPLRALHFPKGFHRAIDKKIPYAGGPFISKGSPRDWIDKKKVPRAGRGLYIKTSKQLTIY
jgi:hypothetical protein